MTTAEKLTTIAENQEKVYNAGKAQRDYEWWDYYQTHLWLDLNKNYQSRSGNRTGYGYAFAGGGWDDKNYNPIRDIIAHTNSYDMFAYSGVSDTKVAIDIANPTQPVNKGNTFRNAQWMKTIRKFIINELSDMKTQFINCHSLENLTIEGTIGNAFEAKSSPLSRASIENVVSCLSTTTTDLTCTFKASAVNKAFETSEEANDGATSNEWLALVASKPNWSFVV